MRVATAVITACLLLLIVVADASWVAVNSASYRLEPREAPVELRDSGNTYTDTVLSANKTKAVVNITIPNQYIISLKSRSAVYWNDFSSDPFSDNSMYVVSGDLGTNWYWDSNGYVVVSLDGTVGDSGEAIALFNMTLPPASTITAVYVEYSFQIASGNGWADLIHYNTGTDYFYTSGLYYGGIFTQALTIYKWNGGWTQIASRSVLASRGRWYDLTVAWYSNGTIAIYSGTNLLLNGTDTEIAPDVFGFGGYYDSGSFRAYFDNVIVSVNRKPYEVVVEGLQNGWTVNIYDDSGNLLVSGTADSSGTATLDFWRYRFVANATIEIKDNNGAVVASQKFSWVCGGDVYELSNPTSSGVIIDFLDYVSLDNDNTYRTALVLSSYTVERGSFTRCVFRIEMDGQTSNDMDILSGDTTTGEIDLYPGYTGKMYVDVLGDQDSVIKVYLFFVYRLNGDYVVYNVTVIINYGV